MSNKDIGIKNKKVDKKLSQGKLKVPWLLNLLPILKLFFKY